MRRAQEHERQPLGRPSCARLRADGSDWGGGGGARGAPECRAGGSGERCVRREGLQSAASAAGSARQTLRPVREPKGPLCASEKQVFPTREHPHVVVRTLLDTVTTTRGVWQLRCFVNVVATSLRIPRLAFVRAAWRWKLLVNVLVSEMCKRLSAERWLGGVPSSDGNKSNLNALPHRVRNILQCLEPCRCGSTSVVLVVTGVQSLS